MIDFIVAGGWVMYPIIFCSIVAMAIIIERLLALRASKIMPINDIELARKMASTGQMSDDMIESLRGNSVIGSVLATGLASSTLPRHIMKENIEEAGRHAVHRLERYMPALGTITTVSPLLGLYGTVLGMITSFSEISQAGIGNPAAVAGGISTALFTTAAGLTVAIVALVFHRYFKSKVDSYVVGMEQESVKLIELVNQQNIRRSATAPTPASHLAASNANGNKAAAAAAAIAAARQRATGG